MIHVKSEFTACELYLNKESRMGGGGRLEPPSREGSVNTPSTEKGGRAEGPNG